MIPAVVPAAAGFTAGIAAGLLFSWGWALAPAAALAAAALWLRGWRLGAVAAAAALSLGALHGAAARTVRVRDCRLAWRNGERLAVRVERAGQWRGGGSGSGGGGLAFLRGSCSGEMRLVSRDSLPVGSAAVVFGAWRRSPVLGASRLARPAGAGVLLVDSIALMGEAVSLRSALRSAAEARLLELFGPRRFALVAALSTSPGARLAGDDRDAFAASGLAHLLSISGFHVGVLAAALVLVFRAGRFAPDASRWAAVAAVGGYVWLLGWPAPAVRAAAALLLWTWARWRQRPPRADSLLAGCVVTVLVVDPWAVLSPGAWLSFAGAFGCVAAAAAVSRLVSEAPDRARRRRLRAVLAPAVTTGAMVATAPVAVAVFGTVAPLALVANLVAAPAAAFAVPAIALALILGAIPGAGPLAAVSAGAAGVALDWLEQTARAMAGLPFAGVEARPRAAAALVAAAAAWLLLRPLAWPARRPAGAQLAARATLAAAVTAAGVAWMPIAARGADDHGRLALHFLPVGQGDAVAVQTPGRQWLLIDAGPRAASGRDAGSAVVAPFLRRRGARRLAVLVASHGDADHLGGMRTVLSQLPAGMVLEPGEPLASPLYREWLESLAAGRARWRAARAGDTLTVDGVHLAIWHPDRAWLERRLPPNENSVVLSLEYGRFRALLPGDAGFAMEAARAARIGRATLLKVGHHGSAGSTGAAWLAAVRPAVCVVPVGANRYGHPHPAVLEALRRAGCATWRTDRDGLVTIVTDGVSVTVRTAAGDTTFAIPEETP